MRRDYCIRSMWSLLAVAVSALWAATPASAQDGAYRIEPWEGLYNDVRVQWWDQKIVAAGDSLEAADPNSMAIARYDFDGVPDGAFGSGGVSTLASPWGYATGLSLQSDGKAVLAGGLNGTFGVARFKTNGALDSTFGSGGWTSYTIPGMQGVNDFAYAVGMQSTGKIVLAGLASPSSSSHVAVAARFKSGGAIDSGNGGFGQVKKGKPVGYTVDTTVGGYADLAIRSDDKIVVLAGNRLARYTAAGTLDTTFGSAGYSALFPTGVGGRSLALQADGKIVLAGTASGIDGCPDMSVIRYSANGALDTSFGGGSGYVRLDVDGTDSQTNEYGWDVAIQPDGKIVVAGDTWVTPNIVGSSVLVARLNTDGTLDETFGTGGFKIGAPPASPDPGLHTNFSSHAVDLQVDGTIIVVGEAATGSGERYPLLMRFDP